MNCSCVIPPECSRNRNKGSSLFDEYNPTNHENKKTQWVKFIMGFLKKSPLGGDNDIVLFLFFSPDSSDLNPRTLAFILPGLGKITPCRQHF